jgi:hypothetical protein
MTPRPGADIFPAACTISTVRSLGMLNCIGVLEDGTYVENN